MSQRLALERVICGAWSASTTSDPTFWSKENSAWGQCAVTACYVQEQLGGDVVRVEYATADGKRGSHYFNILPSGEKLDLTLRQFAQDTQFIPPLDVSNDVLIANTHAYVQSKGYAGDTKDYVLSFPTTQQRYDTLVSFIAEAKKSIAQQGDVMVDPRIHAYLAGPDVFFPDAIEVGKKKKDYLAALGIEGHFPFDNEIPKEKFGDLKVASRAIADANETMMEDVCKDGRIGIILVNMTPFHGPSMDCGSAFEMGYMSALSRRKNVIIIGYSADERSFEQRVIEDVYHHQVTTHPDGKITGVDGNTIEAFGGADNLMLTAAIERTGGRICKTFEEASELAKDLAHKKIESLTQGPERFIKPSSHGVSATRA